MSIRDAVQGINQALRAGCWPDEREVEEVIEHLDALETAIAELHAAEDEEAANNASNIAPAVYYEPTRLDKARAGLREIAKR